MQLVVTWTCVQALGPQVATSRCIVEPVLMDRAVLLLSASAMLTVAHRLASLCSVAVRSASLLVLQPVLLAARCRFAVGAAPRAAAVL
jgi:hypothetical protein